MHRLYRTQRASLLAVFRATYATDLRLGAEGRRPTLVERLMYAWQVSRGARKPE